jgi:hypothetical protein
MTTAASPAPIPTPLREEGLHFWNNLTEECKNRIAAINCSLSAKDRDSQDQIEFRPGEHLSMSRSRHPSTFIGVTMTFERWGPVLRVNISGQQNPQLAFPHEEFELPLALDVDGSIIAIFDEGRSLRPQEVACLLAQSFHRCFPRVSFPCPDLVQS